VNNENAMLNIKDLQLSFFTSTGEVKVLNKVSLSVKKHDTVGLVGESGSGKSATSHAILGLVPSPGKITGGTIDFDGRCISSMTEKEKRSIRGRDISIVSQDPMTSLNPLYTVGSQICEGYMLHVKKDKKAALARTKELL
jgi:oligopeptide transport system ATP-binding protein